MLGPRVILTCTCRADLSILLLSHKMRPIFSQDAIAGVFHITLFLPVVSSHLWLTSTAGHRLGWSSTGLSVSPILLAFSPDLLLYLVLRSRKACDVQDVNPPFRSRLKPYASWVPLTPFHILAFCQWRHGILFWKIYCQRFLRGLRWHPLIPYIVSWTQIFYKRTKAAMNAYTGGSGFGIRRSRDRS